MHKFVTLDLGPRMLVWTATIGDDVVCVVSPKVLTNPPMRQTARTLVKRHGGNCETCRGCPLGQLS